MIDIKPVVRLQPLRKIDETLPDKKEREQRRKQQVRKDNPTELGVKDHQVDEYA